MKKKLLIIRSVSFQQLDRVLKKITRDFKDYHITLLSHKFNLNRVKTFKQINNILEYPRKGNYTPLFIPPKLKKQNFDCVFIPYSNSTGSGFLNILLMALRIKNKGIFSCNLHLDIKPVSKYRILLNFLAFIFIFLISAIFTIPLFIFTAPILFFSFIFKKIKTFKINLSL